MKEWILQQITLKTAKKKKYEVAVLPFGSTEPHNFHLPYGCDTLQCEAIAEKVCEKAYNLGAKVIMLPTIAYGANNNFNFPLTIHMSPSTHLAIVSDIVRSLEARQIYKLVLFNGHAGNNFQFIARELYGKTPVVIIVVDWWKVASDIGEKIFENKGEHADEMETSLALELIPELVHLDDAGNGVVKSSYFEAINRNWVFIVRPWHLLTKDSGYGDPRKASKQKGEKYLSVLVERLSRFLYELSERSLDDKFPY